MLEGSAAVYFIISIIQLILTSLVMIVWDSFLLIFKDLMFLLSRETPTSAGPNSYGKTKLGFCNVTHITEKKWDEKLKKK